MFLEDSSLEKDLSFCTKTHCFFKVGISSFEGHCLNSEKLNEKKSSKKNIIVGKITQPFAQKVSTTEGVHY